MTLHELHIYANVCMLHQNIEAAENWLFMISIFKFLSWLPSFQDATHFVLYAPQSSGVLKFGCSYTLKVSQLLMFTGS